MYKLKVCAGHNYYTRQFSNYDHAFEEAERAVKYYESGGFQFEDSKEDDEYKLYDKLATLMVCDIGINVEVCVEKLRPKPKTENRFPWN